MWGTSAWLVRQPLPATLGRPGGRDEGAERTGGGAEDTQGERGRVGTAGWGRRVGPAGWAGRAAASQTGSWLGSWLQNCSRVMALGSVNS